MKLHALMLIKNEGDFIERSLRHSCRFFDHIYVFDNGSTDNTWTTVRKLADSLPQIVPYKTDARVYEGFMRGPSRVLPCLAGTRATITLSSYTLTV